jgi:hypothetical protein
MTPDDRLIVECWTILVNVKPYSVRFNLGIAQAEAAVKNGVIRNAKLVFRDEPVKEPLPGKPSENGSLPTAEQF